MDSWTFVDHLIGHLAWPAAVCLLSLFVLIRRRDLLEDVVHRFRKAKVGGFEIELAEVKASVERAHLPPAPLASSKMPEIGSTPPPNGERREQLRNLLLVALNEPRRAVMEAYDLVDHYASLAFHQVIDDVEARYGEGSAAAKGAPGMLLRTPAYADLLDRLRNAALRAQDPSESISPGQATDYVLLASRTVGHLYGLVEGYFQPVRKPK